ncbi:excinuclease ABC subunit UvrA [Oscillatoria laete-virens NRMC-F 0139]|nr:excinuclease ABC subunit UvrA [Oscillatoria laete-virens NRMC-F 0139]
MSKDVITIKGARVHNLKNVSITLPREKLVVMTGLSGSGKSSLAFDTIFAEGQRKYVESLSTYARQFLDLMDKPDVDQIEGLSPAIAIEQRTSGSNPRSIIATTTEIFDFLRLLFAHVGVPHCPHCGVKLEHSSVSQVIHTIATKMIGKRIMIAAPLVHHEKGEFLDLFEKIKKEGFIRARVDGQIIDLTESLPELAKPKKHSIDVIIDRLAVEERLRPRIADSVELAMRQGRGNLLVLVEENAPDGATRWKEKAYSENYACPVHGPIAVELSPSIFSFNNPKGACPECGGLGTTMVFDETLIIPDVKKSIADGAVVPWAKGGKATQAFFQNLLRSVVEFHGQDPKTPWHLLPEDLRRTILHGSEGRKIRFKMVKGGRLVEYDKAFEGVIPNLHRRHAESKSPIARMRTEAFMNRLPCPACGGKRLRKEVLAVKVGGQSIMDIAGLSVGETIDLFHHLPLTPQDKVIAEPILKEITSRLVFLKNVGLEYLNLDRENATLSGGEAQRIRLATQIGAGLTGVLYVLDEPSIGLHQRDNERLIKTLEGLRDLGNSVIVVEHDEDTIKRADYIVDMGPRAGILGGEVVAAGTLPEIIESDRSLTAQYLRGDLNIAIPKKRKTANSLWLEIQGAAENNLKNVTARFPVGLITCVTGVSGSGKSTLVMDILCKAMSRKLYRSKDSPGKHTAIKGMDEFDKVIVIDQSPIGRTPRSNPCTYTGMFNDIRELFAQIPAAKIRGYDAGRFSFNVKGGRCEACEGDGVKRIEMNFLPDVYVTCEVCGGKRYNRETLEISYKGKNIADVLDMSVDEALGFFRSIPQIQDKCQALAEVGLGYIRLGQPATQLSGGEAQRIKLATELSKKSTGRTLYIFDEPTTGLHFADVDKLLEVLLKLRDAGNTLVIIEHNLDVIKTADWIIDMGPEGGGGGGQIIAEGPPEKIIACPDSHTARFLKPLLDQPQKARVNFAIEQQLALDNAESKS